MDRVRTTLSTTGVAGSLRWGGLSMGRSCEWRVWSFTWGEWNGNIHGCPGNVQQPGLCQRPGGKDWKTRDGEVHAGCRPSEAHVGTGAGRGGSVLHACGLCARGTEDEADSRPRPAGVGRPSLWATPDLEQGHTNLAAAVPWTEVMHGPTWLLPLSSLPATGQKRHASYFPPGHSG